MYKSSYANFHSKASIEPKSTVIPGYSGYVPYINSENLYAKGYTPLTKDSFSSPKLGKNFNGLSTNGFNVRKETFLNHSKFGESCKYGKTGIQKAHPAWKENIWTSTIKDTYKNPKALNNPVFR